MAKSLRSKWKRKMRHERREKFGKKELERLKEVVKKSEKTGDTEMKKLYTIKTKEEVKKMPGKNINRKTMRDEHGSFPVWMHPRKARSIARKGQKIKRKENKMKKKGKKEKK